MAITIGSTETGTRAGSKTLASGRGRLRAAEAWLADRQRVSPAERMFFFSQLSLMVEIGTPLVAALQSLAQQSRNPAFRKVLQALLVDIEEGRQLSDAMLRFPQLFNRVGVSLVRAGEAGGFLKGSLQSIAAMIERRQALQGQLRATMTYPVILCLMAAAVVIFVLVGILPRFMTLFDGKEALLPPSTRLLMALSTLLRGYWWACLAGAAALVAALAAFLRSESGREAVDRLLVGAPIVAPIYNKAMTCQLLRTLGNLLESQVPLIEALEITRSTFASGRWARFVARISEHVRGGGTLSGVFSQNACVPETVRQMVATGEEMGRLSPVMLRLAEFYDAEVHNDLRTAGSLIEPVALVVIGAVIGLIVSSVILPIFRIAGTVN